MGSFSGIGTLLKDFIVDTLNTVSKTIPGAINELKSNQDELNTKIAKDLSWAPATLLTSKFYNTVAGTYEYISIPTLNQYQEVEVWLYVGDAEVQPYRVNRSFPNAITKTGVYYRGSSSYDGKIKVHVDFTSNRIGVYTYFNAGWALSDMGILKILGLKLV